MEIHRRPAREDLFDSVMREIRCLDRTSRNGIADYAAYSRTPNTNGSSNSGSNRMLEHSRPKSASAPPPLPPGPPLKPVRRHKPPLTPKPKDKRKLERSSTIDEKRMSSELHEILESAFPAEEKRNESPRVHPTPEHELDSGEHGSKSATLTAGMNPNYDSIDPAPIAYIDDFEDSSKDELLSKKETAPDSISCYSFFSDESEWDLNVTDDNVSRCSLASGELIDNKPKTTPNKKNAGKRFKKKAAAHKEKMGALWDAAAGNATDQLKKLKQKSMRFKDVKGTTMSLPRFSKIASGKSSEGPALSNGIQSNGCSDDSKLSPLQERSVSSPSGEKAAFINNQQGAIKCGYLKKFGGNNFKNWNERWFVLREDSLHYYKDMDGKHLGSLVLIGTKINTLPVKSKEPNKFAFEITPGADRMKTNNNESYVLSANSPADMEEWVKVIRRVILSPFGGGIFGQKLDETMRHERRLDSSGCGTTSTGSRTSSRGSRRQAPIIVENCVEFIRTHGGLSEEGLFRLPGHANEVKELQDSYDMGDRPVFPGTTDVHTVASLLKGYLRELPEPVIPFDQYEPLISSAKLLSANMTDDINDKKIAESQKLFNEQLKLLPQSNFELLRYICRFLDEVQLHSSVNKMDVSNLAMVFGPNIMRSKQEDPMLMMADASYVQEVMKQFISNHKIFFPDNPELNPAAPSIPDVAVDAEGIPTDAGFGTLTSTVSPLGTLGQRHATDDSGTGSLGPTPENTSKRAAPPVPAHPPPLRGKPNKPIRRKISGLEVETNDQRKSFYDNVTASSQAGSDVTPNKVSSRVSDWRRSNGSGDAPSVSVPTEESFYVNNVSTPSVPSVNVSDSPRSSTNAVAGSVCGRDSFLSNPAEEPPSSRSRVGRPKRRIRSIDENLTDEESNTESVPPDDRAFSTLSSHRGSIPHEPDIPRMEIRTSVRSRSDLASRSSVGSSDGASPSMPKIPSRPHRRNKTSSQNSNSRPNSNAETDMTSASAAVRDRDAILPNSMRTSHVISSGSTSVCGRPLSYKEMEEHVKILQEELRKQRIEHEKRSRMLEEHYIMKMKSSTSVFPSSPTSAVPSDFRARIGSNTEESLPDSCTTSFLDQQLDHSLLSRQQSTDSLSELKYREEVKKHAMTRIKLRNAERGLKQSEERNQQLQKEMEEFFNTFGGMLANNM